MKKLFVILFVITLGLSLPTSCKKAVEEKEKPFLWENANVYFLLTDRFNNADKSNDVNFGRTEKTADLRGFEGGDLKGIIAKIKDGYFTKLGIDAIWLSPVFEQIHGLVDEGTGATYGYHAYWTKDWTNIEPNFGTFEILKELVDVAHKNGLRIVMDVIINHTGPVTDKDPQWDDNWVRTSPKCQYKDYLTTIRGPLVDNLPDIRTDSNEEVELPKPLVEKWKKEGRYEQEKKELDEFFKITGLPRAPRFYIMKWLVDYIKELGVDAFRVDTTKHTEEYVWLELWKLASKAFENWKTQNPDKKIDDTPFYMVGEVYGYNVANDQLYNFGDSIVNYYDHGFKGLINFGFKDDVNKSYEELFSYYSSKVNSPLKGKAVMNYISSHDDSHAFDRKRERLFEGATKLLLCPGSSQVYYGNETARDMNVKANGDASLRSFMNWSELRDNKSVNGVKVQDLYKHYQKLGKFRSNNVAIGAGVHKMITEKPYVFSRVYNGDSYTNKVVVALDAGIGEKTVSVGKIFADGIKLKDYYSGKTVTVKGGKVKINTKFGFLLLGEK